MAGSLVQVRVVGIPVDDNRSRWSPLVASLKLRNLRVGENAVTLEVPVPSLLLGGR